MEVQERTQEAADLVSLTPSAADKIRTLMAEDTDVSVLRVAIEGGGCEGVKVVVDPFSAPYLRGARVDYLETIQESGFKIDNPNAVSSCGCGHSFQVEDDAVPSDVGGCGSGCSA